ncbi:MULTISPECIES: carboxy-S-adenosyl-L-methionine synthase CmoA [unclassified Campylobacter]|uniref:carboxy-S-adenosyl-L-methionine synthase CmoA n=1 Tax=unclassified Campylobacter TaxID=2593542 RepID=UPI001452162D|nr:MULTISPECIES: carboxy-S-adenosyl-L-methionine synthase CmoA [unclassified Campylobacter]QCD52883.1 carboxy-S-adenosyl-L-methionine synthase [Campylobacter sp. RM16192]
MRDEIFKEPIKKQFEFDAAVASVFDDMINRSVPHYDIAQSLIVEFLVKTLKKEAFVLDLGCSTASTLLRLYEARSDLNLRGIDNAAAMLENANAKIRAYGANITLELADILECDLGVQDAVLMNYTLQFIRPIKRQEFVGKIYESLNENGIFVFSEKMIFEDKTLSKNIIEIYENYKLNQGYSKFEIAQKREALENVLIPYTESENRELALNAGFKSVECLFRWANFATFIAFK